MKLHFYFLEKTRIRCEECDVIEKPKTYYPVNRFPDGIYTAFFKKDEVDRVRYHYGRTFIILTEMNKERAAEAFVADRNYEISCRENKIRVANEEIQELKETVSMIEQWRAGDGNEQ